MSDAPLAEDFDERFMSFAEGTVAYDETAGRYTVGGSEGGYAFGDPDFTFLQFRSNLVVRWEYLPSSTLLVVWSQRSNGVGGPAAESTGGADPAMGVLRALGEDLFGDGVHNTFLIKAMYRWVR